MLPQAMPSSSSTTLNEVKNTTCIYRCFAAFAARDARSQQDSEDGTTTGENYKNNQYLLSARDAAKNYLAQFPRAALSVVDWVGNGPGPTPSRRPALCGPPQAMRVPRVPSLQDDLAVLAAHL